MIKKISNASIQLKILVLFLLMGALLTAAFGITFYQKTLDNAVSNKEKEMLNLADITSNKIERFLFERRGDAKVLAQSNIFFNPEIPDQIKQTYLENVMNAYQAYDAIYILNKSGTIESYCGDSSYNQLPSHLVSDFLNLSDYVSDILSSDNSERYLYFASPILSENHEVLGAVVERMNFQAIDAIIDNIQIGDTGYAKLEMTDGSAHFSKLNTLTLRGQTYYQAVSPLIQYPSQNNPWHIAIYQNKEDALGVKADIEKYLTFIVITSILLFIVLSYYISRRITQPIRNLKQKISMLMKNNRIFASDVVVSDEVKTLASSFDLLLDELNFMMQQVLEKSGEVAYIKEIRQSIDSLFEHMPNGIITIDANGYISSINTVATELLSLGDQDLVHKNAPSQVPQHLKAFFHMITSQVSDSQNFHNEIYHYVNASGTSIPIIFSTLNQYDLYDNLIGITVIINHFDAKKDFDESIFRAKRLAELGELSAGVAHEIRNPLASIKGYAQVALLDLDEKDQLDKDLKVILSEVNRLEKILDRFMTFARPNPPHFNLCHLNPLIKETIEQIQKGLKVGNINIRHRYTKNDLVYIDPNQIKQVLINLILNAIQAMPEGGHIDLVTLLNEGQDMMEIHIVDDGEGIPKGVIEKIFSPFFTTRDTGTGLGLAICSRIIENHKGIIDITNNQSQGTQVIIKLPVEKGNTP
jgi:PAS domain S-box-containing protein